MALAAGVVVFGFSRTHRPSSSDFVKKGQKYLAARDYQGAVLEFENAIQAAPKNAEAQYQLALAYVGLGRAEAVAAYLTKAVELDPKYVPARRYLAGLMALNQDPNVVRRAQEHAREALRQSPGDLETSRILAVTEFRLGQTAEAETRLQQILTRQPGDLRAAALLAEAHLSRRNPKRAEEVLLTASSASPHSTDGLLLLARFYASQGQPQEAEKRLREALQIDPQNGAALLNLGVELLRAERVAEADGIFLQLSQLPQPQFKPLYGMFLLRTGKAERAVLEFERLARLDPNDRHARSRLAAAYVTARRAGDAERLLAKAVAKDPADETAGIELSEVHVLSGKPAEAERDLAPLARSGNDSAAFHYALARVYSAGGKRSQEIVELERVLQLKPNLLAARMELARSLIASRKSRDAIDVMDRAPAGQRGVRAAMIVRNWALIAAGEWEQAEKNITRALAGASAPDVLLQRALLRIRHRDYPGALAITEQAIKASPNDARSVELRARALALGNRGPSAMALVRERASSPSGSAEMQYLLGTWSLASGNRAEARSALSAAVRLDPSFRAAQIALAQVSALDGDPEAERERLVAVLSQNNGDFSAHLMLAELEERRGNRPSAIAHYRQALDLDSSSLPALNNLAYLLAKESGHLEEALQLAQQALSAAPDDPSVNDTQGLVLYAMGDYGAALRYFEKALAAGRSPVREYHFAMACLRTGDRKRGFEAARTALEMDPKLPEARELNALLNDGTSRPHGAGGAAVR